MTERQSSRPKVKSPKTRPAKNSFAAALVTARLSKGLTRADMARLYGAAPTVISRLESGRCKIGEATIRKYAAALGMHAKLVFAKGRRAR